MLFPAALKFGTNSINSDGEEGTYFSVGGGPTVNPSEKSN